MMMAASVPAIYAPKSARSETQIARRQSAARDGNQKRGSEHSTRCGSDGGPTAAPNINNAWHH